MPTTTNFGWTTPADTDLVSQGAAAMRTLGNGVDTSFVKLKGGTTGQTLVKNSDTDLDFTWSSPPGTTLLGSASLTGTSSVNITSISQSYTDLIVRVYLPVVSGAGVFGFRLNGLSTSNYANLSQQVSGTTITQTGSSSATSHVLCATAPTAAASGYAEIRIADYTTSSNVKLIQSSYVNNGTGIHTTITQGTFRGSNAAATSITIYTSSIFGGGSVSVYGVK